MATTKVDPREVVKLANTRAEEFDGGTVKKLGSRVTTTQVSTVTKVATPAALRTIKGDGDDGANALKAYAETGDASHLSPEQNEALKKLVAQAREASENPSKARRIWPRKVAAIVVSLDGKPAEQPAASE